MTTIDSTPQSGSAEVGAEQDDRFGIHSYNTLPVAHRDGITFRDDPEGPVIALAPAATFEDGRRWRPHYGQDLLNSSPDDMPLCWLLIRDDLSLEDTKAAVAEAWGWLFVADFGDDFPQLPVAPVYAPEGRDMGDTPWPLVRVPPELWAGCDRNFDNGDLGAASSRFDAKYMLWSALRDLADGFGPGIGEGGAE